jgi:hypothetical protein
MVKTLAVSKCEKKTKHSTIAIDWNPKERTLHLEEHRVIFHRGYDKLLCNYVYFGFCPDCGQYNCIRRRV